MVFHPAKLAAALLLVVACGSAAKATTFNFNSGWGVLAPGATLNKAQDGISLTVTPGTYAGTSFSPGNGGARISQNGWYGLGVLTLDGSSKDDRWSGLGFPTYYAIDGAGYHEMLQFGFDQKVQLTSVDVNLYRGAIDLVVDGTTLYSNLSVSQLNSMIIAGISGTTFGFGADAFFANCFYAFYDAFKIRGIGVVTAVPLPAGLPLLGAGVALLALLGRRKRAGAQSA